MRPVEGTILTVVRASRRGRRGRDGDGGRPSMGMLEAARDAAGDAVRARPSCCRCSSEAGVVDAGGRGFTLLLDAFLEVVAGRPIPEPAVVTTPRLGRGRTAAGGDVASGLRYEVMYLLEAEDSTIDAFKQRGPRSATRSSSSAATGSGTATSTPTTSAVRSKPGSRPGRPRQIRVTDLLEQVEEREGRDWVDRGGAGRRPGRSRPRWSRSAVGDGIRRAARSASACRRSSRGPVDEPVDRADPRSGGALPGRVGDHPAEQQEHRPGGRAGRRPDVAPVQVVPTHSVLEALAALMAYDPDAPARRQRDAMTDAASTGARRARSPRRCATAWPSAGRSRRATGSRSGGTASARDRHRGRGGDRRCSTCSSTRTARSSPCSSAPTRDAADTERAAGAGRAGASHVEVEVHEGGQPLYPYLIGVE